MGNIVSSTSILRLTLACLPCVLQDQTAKECGLHSGNIVSSAESQAAGEAADLWASGPVEALDHDALAKLADGSRNKDTLVVLYAPWCQFSQVSRACKRSYLSRVWFIEIDRLSRAHMPSPAQQAAASYIVCAPCTVGAAAVCGCLRLSATSSVTC